MKIRKGQKLVMIGDSITDVGRVQPVAEGLFDPLGRGYVAQVEALLGATVPELGIRVVNVGNSGNTVRDLKARWDRDVVALKPDWLSILIGINDVWRQFDLPRMKETHVGIQEYERTLDELLRRTRPMVKGLVLLTPYFIEPNRRDAMRRRMDAYGAVVKRLAKRHDAVLVDVQAAFDRLLRHQHPAALAWDRIHPNQTGHMTIARAFLNAIGYQW
jgi:lysophospholipase L1-like esterase